MGFLSDIEIAQSVQLKEINTIAKNSNIDEKYLENYGRYKAKVNLSYLTESKTKKVNSF